VGEAISIEERLHGLFAGRRHKMRERHAEPDTPRDVERRAMEQLYGERSKAVVRVERRPGDDET